MNKTAYDTQHTDLTIQQTSEDMAWEVPRYPVAETALEVTAHPLGASHSTTSYAIPSM